MKTEYNEPFLAIGQLVATTNCANTVPQVDIEQALERHRRGDWGDVGKEDWDSNDQAVMNGDRILSSYRSSNGTKFWIITEHDRSVTTILLPEDY